MRSKRLIVAAIVLVVVGALAAFAYRIYLNPVRDTAIDLVPRGAVLYGSLFLSPSTHQKQELGALLKHFPQARTPELAKSALEQLLDPQLERFGIDFTHDVEPWLGRQIAFFAKDDGAGSLAVGLLIATRDPNASMRALEKVADAQLGSSQQLSYDGTDYFRAGNFDAGVVGSFAVVASDEDVFRAVVRASTGSSLASEQDFKTTTASLPKDRVATLYVHSSLVTSLLTIPGLGPLSSVIPLFSDLPSVGVGAFLRSDAIVFDGEMPGPGKVSPAAALSLRAALSAVLPDSIHQLFDRLVSGRVGPGGDRVATGVNLDGVQAELGNDYALKGVIEQIALGSVVAEAPKLPVQTRIFLEHLVYIALGTRTDHDTLFARIVIGVN